VLVTDSSETVVSRNEVRFLAREGPLIQFGRDNFRAYELGRLLQRILDFEPEPDPRLPRLPADLAVFVRQWRTVRDAYLQRYPTERRAVTALLLDAFEPVGAPTRPPDSVVAAVRRVVRRLLTELWAGGQGIVVAGGTAGTVRVLDNLVAGFVQGIHVGTSRSGPDRDLAAQVLISGNIVHALTPTWYARERHGVFVGNARSVHVTDTIATLRHTAGPVFPLGRGPVEGIRVHGVLGPYVVVRHSSLSGFQVGVRARALAPQPNQGRRLWLIAETMADGAVPRAVDAPDFDLERNFP
jgi:hypothetical protein